MADERLQIGEFARRAGTSLRTLRYYEELGLLSPLARSEGGFRHYSVAQLDRVAAIRRLQGVGLSLEEIAKLLTGGAPAPEPGDGRSPGERLVTRLADTLQQQIAVLEARIAELRKDLDELQHARTRLIEQCGPCDRPLSKEHCDPCPRDRLPLPAALRALL